MPVIVIIKLTRKQKEILFGCLLGDASLQTFTGGNTWRARFIQSDLHHPYLFHLYSIFSTFVSTPPKQISDSNGYLRWYFNTVVIPDLFDFGSCFYQKIGGRFKKVVPTDSYLVDFLTPQALSFWFMDDGSRKSNSFAYYLCTDGLNLADIKRLGMFFESTYGISIGYHRKGNYYRIYIPRPYYNKFKSIVQPFIHPSMFYKL